MTADTFWLYEVPPGFCACKRARVDCDARCAVCGSDGNWSTQFQGYRCSGHERVAEPNSDVRREGEKT